MAFFSTSHGEKCPHTGTEQSHETGLYTVHTVSLDALFWNVENPWSLVRVYLKATMRRPHRWCDTQSLNPEWIETTPPVKLKYFTQKKPASSIISLNVSYGRHFLLQLFREHQDISDKRYISTFHFGPQLHWISELSVQSVLVYACRVTWSGNFRMLSTRYWYDFQSPAITSPNTGIIWKLYASYSLQKTTEQVNIFFNTFNKNSL